MRFAALLVVAALGTRLAVVLWLADTVPYSDFALYHAAGIEIARDPGFLFDRAATARLPHFELWPPGYPVFLAAVYALFGPSYRNALFVQVLLGVCVCWLVYRFAALAGGECIGRTTALLIAFDPVYVFRTNLVASENLFVFWMALGLWLLEIAAGSAPASAGRDARVRTEVARNRWRLPFVSGAVFGLAALTRAIGLLLPVSAFVRLHGAQPHAWRACCAWLLLGFAATLAPWTLRNTVVAGRPALVCFGGGLNFYFGHNDAGLGHRDLEGTPLAGLRDPAAIDAAGFREGWRRLAARPAGFVTRGVRKIVSLYGFPDDALHANSGIAIPDARGRPDLEALAQQKLARQRSRDRLLHGGFMALTRGFHLALLALAVAALIGWRARAASAAPDASRGSAAVAGPFLASVWLVLLWTAAHVVFWAQPRFAHPLHIPLAFLAAFSLRWLWQRGRRSLSRAEPNG